MATRSWLMMLINSYGEVDNSYTVVNDRATVMILDTMVNRD